MQVSWHLTCVGPKFQHLGALGKVDFFLPHLGDYSFGENPNMMLGQFLGSGSMKEKTMFTWMVSGAAFAGFINQSGGWVKSRVCYVFRLRNPSSTAKS